MSHNHQHSHAPANYNRIFAFGILLNITYVAVEAGIGFAVDSLALLADAGHNLSDVLGLLLAWAGHYLSQRKPTARLTYGLRSSSILAAFFNALLLMAAVGAIAWEAIKRFSDSVEVPGTTIMIVAGVGVVVNLLTAVMFLRGRHEDINIRGAFLHMAADAGVSVGVVVAGLLTSVFGWLWLDPSISLVIAGVILLGTWGLFKESTSLILQAVPAGIDPVAVGEYLNELPGVQEFHDLHIWAMSTTETALTVHLVVPDEENADAFIQSACHGLHDQFGIEHATLQIERKSDNGCPLAPTDVV